MNCKKGDLAYVSAGPNVGKIVRCVEYLGVINVMTPAGVGMLACWHTEPALPGFCTGKLTHVCSDRSLRPIRPGPGEDEMLRIAGKPPKVQRRRVKA